MFTSTLPFLIAIQQIPSYAKFLKDLCTVKRKTQVPRDVFRAESTSSFVQQEGVVKYKDPGRPIVLCKFGENYFGNGLLDLGSSVNVLPYYLYKELGLKDLKPARVNLELADHSIKVPRGIVEDVLVKVSDFYYPVNFFILDTEPSVNNKAHIILGRPFLATANCLINCRDGTYED